MIRLLFLIVRQYLHCIKYHVPISSTSINRGLHMYFHANNRKNLIKVFIELSWLCNKWRAFPDTYFRFRMFEKTYTNKKQILSFIPQGAYSCLNPSKDPRYNLLIDDKILFHDIMTLYGFKVPKRYFIFRNNTFRLAGSGKFLTDIEVDNLISGIEDDVVFVKYFTGGAASGVSIFTRNANNKLCNTDGCEVTAAMIRDVYANKDIFLEKRIKQENVLASFNSDTVNTIRVLTYKNKVVSAAVRFGRINQFVDNTAKGGVAVSLDIDSGKLGDYGEREYDIKKYYEHPDSHLKFSKVFVPQWESIKNLVEDVCKCLPYYTSVGFDVATTDEGPVIIEINTGAGVYLSQMGKEYGIANKFLN